MELAVNVDALRLVGPLAFPDRLELLRPGEMIEAAASLAAGAIAPLPGGEGLLLAAFAAAGQGADEVAIGDFALDLELQSGPTPDLKSQSSDGAAVFGAGELAAAIQGGMPDFPPLQGDPPSNFDTGVFDRTALPAAPEIPPEPETPQPDEPLE